MILAQPDFTLPVDAVGSLDIESPGGDRFRFVGDGRLVSLEFGRMRDLLRVRRSAATLAAVPLPVAADRGLRPLCLTAEIRVRGWTVASSDAGTRAGPFSRALGIAPLSLRFLPLLGAVILRTRRGNPS